MSKKISPDKLDKMTILVEEAARATEEGVKYFVEPAPGTLLRAHSRRHHIAFGRRGSGKSSLLRKAAADLTVDRRPIAYVNMEGFKGHSYPDVLLSVLIKAFSEFEYWLKTAAINPATKTTFWKKLFGTIPTRKGFNKSESKRLAGDINKIISELKSELYRSDESEVIQKSGSSETTASTSTADIKASVHGIGGSASKQTQGRNEKQQEIEEKFKNSKTDFIHRHILEYQKLFDILANISGSASYLFLDDLYHIKKADQPKVLDYFHRIAKDHNLWLKIGTIRHRSQWYLRGDPPIGLKLGDDADKIDLDLTLEKYKTTKDFLLRILRNFANEAALGSMGSFITPGAIDRLVIASGGVARDFLSIFRRSVDIMRERAGGHRGDKIGTEDVNRAAGENDSTKREEFKLDTSDDTNIIEDEFQKLSYFCLNTNNTNCFLLDKESQGEEVDLIHELVDLKFIHLVKSRVTISGKPNKIYEAYMIDLSQYAGARKRRGLNLVDFWKSSSTEALRKITLIYKPSSTM